MACWLTGLNGRIELIQSPQPKPAPDAFGDQHYVGYYHLSFDLTENISNLPEWLEKLTNNFQQAHQEDADLYQPLNILLPPQQQMIGNHLYEVTFIADTDGLPLEFIRRLT